MENALIQTTLFSSLPLYKELDYAVILKYWKKNRPTYGLNVF